MVWQSLYDAVETKFKKQQDEERKSASKVYVNDIQQLVGTALFVEMIGGQPRIHYGDDATFDTVLHNRLPVPLVLDLTSINLLMPPETGLGGTDAGRGCRQAEPSSEKTLAISPGNSVSLRWICRSDLSATELYGKSWSFRPGDTYQARLSAQLSVESRDGQAKATTTVSRLSTIAIDLPPMVIAVTAVLGCLLGGLMHGLVRQAFLRHLDRDRLDPRLAERDAFRDLRYMLLVGVASALLTLVLAPLSNISVRSAQLVSMRIIDNFGALFMGVLMHFVIYDLGYNKILPFIKKYAQ